MARSLFVREETKARFRGAVEAVEARTCAEIVVAVQPRSASWAGIDCAMGAALAYLVLLYTLFAPQVFGLLWIAVMVPLGFAVGFGLPRVLPGLRLRLAGAARVAEAVERGARARFVELGVSVTRERSGVLVYVSLVERACKVVADIGVLARVPEQDWARTVARIEGTIAAHGLGEAGCVALCEAVEGLGLVLEGPMPRAADDINELEDVA